MKYKIIRQDGVVEYRNDTNPPINAILLNDVDYESEIYSLSIQPSLTFNQKLRAIEAAFDNHLDEVASLRGYGRIGVSPSQACLGYASYPNQWQAEAVKYGQWVSSCCALMIQGQADVITGIRTMPTPEQAIAELPAMLW